MEFLYTDCESLLTQFKRQEKKLRIKRRWLMGLDMSSNGQKKLKRQSDRTIPESLLREDDVSYETIRTLVEGGFGATNDRTKHHVVQKSMNLFGLANNQSDIFLLIDGMSNKGLYLLAETLTAGTIKFEKVRWKLKKIVKERLLLTLRNKNGIDRSKHISQLLMDPKNFRDNFIKPLIFASQDSFNRQKDSQYYYDAATEVLGVLDKLPIRTLLAMQRKLRGIQGYTPQLNPKNSGWGRGNLTDNVRKNCNQILSELEEDDELPEPLAKAMDVAGLSLKLLGHPYEKEFQKFSAETKALQNEIAKAISLLKKVRFQEMKNLRSLLDPRDELSDRNLRWAVRNLLTEYLLECSDMDTVPESLSETLAIINRHRSRSARCRIFSKKEIEEEVECVLSVGAQIKQMVWDFLPKHEFDQDYVNAYMENSEESDNSDGFDDTDDDKQEELLEKSRFLYSDDQIESTGETNPTNSTLPSVITRANFVDLSVSASSNPCRESKVLDRMENMDGSLGLSKPDSHKCKLKEFGSSPSFSPDGRPSSERKEPNIGPENLPENVPEENIMHDKQSTSGNNYLALQEACDETSMVAYRLIGFMLDEFAQIEGHDLDHEDISYLRSSDSSTKHSRAAKEDEISYEEDVRGSIVIQVLEELIPSFPTSGKEKVRGLMGLK